MLNLIIRERLSLAPQISPKVRLHFKKIIQAIQSLDPSNSPKGITIPNPQTTEPCSSYSPPATYKNFSQDQPDLCTRP